MRTFKYILVGLVAVAFLIGGVTMFTPLGSDEASGKSSKSEKSRKSRNKGQPISVEVSPKKPFQIFIRGQGPAREIELEFATVPPGKRLVMQHVSLTGTTKNDPVNLNVACRIRTGETGLLGDPELHLLVTTNRNKGLTAFDGHIAGGPITFYGEPGDVVIASCSSVPALTGQLEMNSGVTFSRSR